MTDNPRIYRVSELANEMRNLLEMSYASVWIEGELSTLSKPASGHLYFTIKDDDAQIRCAMFRNQVLRLPFVPEVGEQVKIKGKLSIYTARGDLQCIAQSMEKAGEGELFKAFEMLKQKLSQQGLFDLARKRKLPDYPRNIGVISSPSAAALQDILTTLKRRCPGIPITLYPSLVQGDRASEQLIAAINLANEAQRSDVLILARGGGSIEDLWGFNNEALAFAIADSAIPIISAVGHEVDFTIADFVADLRAPTPTAAAELVAPDVDSLQQKLLSVRHRLIRQTQRVFENHAQTVDAISYRLVHPATRIRNAKEQLQRVSDSLHRQLAQQLLMRQTRLQGLAKRLNPELLRDRVFTRENELVRMNLGLRRVVQRQLRQHQEKLEHAGASLNLVNPLATLERGYSITRDDRQQIVRSASNELLGKAVFVQLKHGSLECHVEKVLEP